MNGPHARAILFAKPVIDIAFLYCILITWVTWQKGLEMHLKDVAEGVQFTLSVPVACTIEEVRKLLNETGRTFVLDVKIEALREVESTKKGMKEYKTAIVPIDGKVLLGNFNLSVFPEPGNYLVLARFTSPPIPESTN